MNRGSNENFKKKQSHGECGKSARGQRQRDIFVILHQLQWKHMSPANHTVFFFSPLNHLWAKHAADDAPAGPPQSQLHESSILVFSVMDYTKVQLHLIIQIWQLKVRMTSSFCAAQLNGRKHLEPDSRCPKDMRSGELMHKDETGWQGLACHQVWQSLYIVENLSE